MNGFTTPQEDGNDCEQGSTYGVAGTSHSRPNAVIYHVTKAFVTTVSFKCFTNTVEDYDGTVNGVTYNGQECCNEGRIHFLMQQGEVAQSYQYVDNQGDNRCNSKLKFKTQSNVGNHQYPRKTNRHYSLLNQFAANGSAHLFNTLNLEFAQFVTQVSHNLTTQAIIDNTGTNQYVFRSFFAFNVFQLDNAVAKIMFFHYITNFSNGYCLIEGQVHNATTGKVNAQVETFEQNGTNTDYQERNSDCKKDFPVFNDRKHYLDTSLAVSAFGAATPKIHGFLVKLV